MRVVILMVLGYFLSACSSHFSSNAEYDYIKANNGPMVQVPPNLSPQELSHYYVLPNPTGPAGVSIVPPVSLD